MPLSVKTKEHFRRRMALAGPKWGALMGGAVALAGVIMFTTSALQKLRRRYSTHLLLLAFVGIAAGVALGYTGSANWVILFLPCVWAVLTCRDTGMGKPLLLFTLGLAVLDAIIKQTAFLESFSLSNFLWNLASGCILYAVVGGIGWLIGWLLHYAKETTHENKE